MHTLYWTASLALCGFLVFSAGSYLFHAATIEAIRAMGLPDYLRVQLALMKAIAVVVLLVPVVPLIAKEWAYAGVFFFLLTAIVAHAVHHDPWYLNAVNIVLIGLLISSRLSLPA